VRYRATGFHPGASVLTWTKYSNHLRKGNKMLPKKLCDLITKLDERWEKYCENITTDEKTGDQIGGYGTWFREPPSNFGDIPWIADELLLAANEAASSAPCAEFNRLATSLTRLAKARTKWLSGDYEDADRCECFSLHTEALSDFWRAREQVSEMLAQILKKRAQHRPPLESVSMLKDQGVSAEQAAKMHGVTWLEMRDFYDDGTPAGYVPPATLKQRDQRPQPLDAATRGSLAAAAAAITESRKMEAAGVPVAAS